MYKSYFIMAIRSMLAYKGTTTINILGLVVGIAAALVTVTVIRFELSFDSFHTNRLQTYRVVRVSGKEMSEYRTGVSYPVPEVIKAEVPSLELVASVQYFGGANVEVLNGNDAADNRFREESGFAFVEPEFFKVFDFRGTNFKWLAGNPATALTEPLGMVLTRSMEKKYFGDEGALGQTIKLQHRHNFKITGVIEDLPPNTDFPFTVLMSYSSMTVMFGPERFGAWGNVTDEHQTFVVLKPHVDQKEVEAQIAKVHAAHTWKDLYEDRHYLLQPLSEVHFDAKFGNFNRRTISRQTVLALEILALFLLITASINYVNLSTAQSALRAKEIGLRKVMGSNRSQLVGQFLTETFLIVLAAGIIGLSVSEIALINLQPLLNLKLDHYNFSDPFILKTLFVMILLVTFFSGLYPAFVISKFNPVATLKNKLLSTGSEGVSLRKVLVVVQFTITQMLVVGTYIVVSQMNFFQNENMGFVRDGVVTMRVPVRTPSLLQTLEAKLRTQSFVQNVSFSYTLPGGVSRNNHYTDIGLPEAENKDLLIYEYVSIDTSFLNLYQIKLLAGRNLIPQDSSGNIIINNKLVRNLQLGSPQEAVGRQLKMSDGTPVVVVGVIDDYYSNSLKEGADNIVMLIRPEDYAALSVKFNLAEGSSLPEMVESIGKIWSSAFPDYIFNYRFLDENIADYYQQEQKYADLFQLFSTIFLFIGCLGLYGLITFAVNRKSKEVAIRKVLGASLSNILSMFSKEYVRLIILSFVLAAPVAWYVSSQWLSNFTNHITIQWWLFIAPGMLVLTVAIMIIGTKSVYAANTDPVKSLRSE